MTAIRDISVEPDLGDVSPTSEVSIAQVVLVVLIVLVAMVSRSPVFSFQADAGRTVSVSNTLDPNASPWWELTALPGIGESRARGIVAFRDGARKTGSGMPASKVFAFTSATDLALVRGIGPKTVHRIRPWLRFD